MAKEFKDFDEKYKHLHNTYLPGEKVAVAYAWPYMEDYRKHLELNKIAEIRKATYSSEGAEAWQQFRVSMKGWSTQVKLGRLSNRLDKLIDAKIFDLKHDEHIRINNYIGALIRGGQLSAEGEILK